MIGSLYEKYVLPKLLDCCCSTKPVSYQRNKLVPLAKGTVLEVGIGSGLNIPFYDVSCVDKVIGLDPSEELNQIAEKKAEKSELQIEFLINGAEEIHLPEKSVDTVLITYTLCTIPDFDSALKEMKRVLKDDGLLIILETSVPSNKFLKFLYNL